MERASKIEMEPRQAFDTVTLDYDGRFQRRRVMRTDNGLDFLLDLPKTIDMQPGSFLCLESNRYIEVLAASERLMKVCAESHTHLVRLAWHIGNRHLPCVVASDFLLIHYDHVIGSMIETLGGAVCEVNAPFVPEGGAYGVGRTHTHEH